MKLFVCSGYYGHVELAENDVVKTGPFAGLDQRQLFERIMQDGYGNNVPAVFHAEYKDGEVKRFSGKDAAGLIDDPLVIEITVLAPIAGGGTLSPAWERAEGEGAVSKADRNQYVVGVWPK